MTTLNNTRFSHVRGFNYQPSFGAHELELLGHHFDLAIVRAELERGKQLFPRMNTVRLWWSHACHVRWPERTAARCRDILDLGPALGLQFVPILFNGWHSIPDFGGQTPNQLRILQWGGLFERWVVPYLRDVVVANQHHGAVLFWDLCNEPYFSGAASDLEKRRWAEFFARVRSTIKAEAPAALLTIGCVADSTPTELDEFCDVMTFHPYFGEFSHGREAWSNQIDAFVEQANRRGKALVATETGWGSLDDARRAESLGVELPMLAERGIGFMIHALNDSPVADLHRPECGPLQAPGYMACIEADGSLRPHHGIINTYF